MCLYRADEFKKLELDRSIKVMNKQIQAKLTKLCAENPGSYSKDKKDDYFSRLAAGVRQADEFRLKTAVAEKARKLLDEYIEARMDPSCRKLLEDGLKQKDKVKLEAGLKICADEGYRTSLSRKCSELLEKMTDCEAAIDVAIGEADEEYLNKALAMADEISFNSPRVQEARAMLEKIQFVTRSLASAKESKDHNVLKEVRT